MGRSWTACAGAIFLFWSFPARAEDASHLESRCERLSAAEYEEVDARVQLLLRSAGRGVELPVVACDDTSAWVEWEGERLPVALSESPADDFLDVIEARLRTRASAAAVSKTERPETPPAPATPAPGPSEDDRPESGARSAGAATSPARAKRSDVGAASGIDGGGASLSAQLEPGSDDLGTSFGPSLDFGGVLGPLTLLGREALRFGGRGEFSVMQFDLMAGVGWGAPFARAPLVGFAARGGAEWLIVYPDGTSARSSVGAVINVSSTAAHDFGKARVFLSVEGMFRPRAIDVRVRESLSAPNASVLISLGVAAIYTPPR